MTHIFKPGDKVLDLETRRHGTLESSENPTYPLILRWKNGCETYTTSGYKYEHRQSYAPDLIPWAQGTPREVFRVATFTAKGKLRLLAGDFATYDDAVNEIKGYASGTYQVQKVWVVEAE